MYKANEILVKNLLSKDYSNDDLFYKAIDKSKSLIGLTLEESLILLKKSEDLKYKEILIDSAKKVTDKIFDQKVSIFVPLYISNYCRNTCQLLFLLIILLIIYHQPYQHNMDKHFFKNLRYKEDQKLKLSHQISYR